MTQSLTVAQSQTNRKGIYAKLEQTLDDIEFILSGDLDDVDPEEFLYIEKIDVSKFRKIAEKKQAEEEAPPEPEVELKDSDQVTQPDVAFPKKKSRFNFKLPFQKTKKSTLNIDPNHPPMTLTQGEINRIKREKEEARESRNKNISIEEKYKMLLAESAQMQTKNAAPPLSPNVKLSYSPTKMTTEAKKDKKEK